MNKAKYIREKLGYSKTEAGNILLGIRNRKAAYDTFLRHESSVSYTNGVDTYFDLLIEMIRKGNSDIFVEILEERHKNG